MKIRLLMCALCLLQGMSCSKKSENAGQQGDARLKDFDHWAVQHLKRPLNLYGLSQRDSCNIAQLIASNLDSLVRSETSITIVWPYFIRNYYIGGMDFRFSILKDGHDVTHFVHGEELNRWVEDRSNAYKRKEPSSANQSDFSSMQDAYLQLRSLVKTEYLNTSALSFMYNDPDLVTNNAGDWTDLVLNIMEVVYDVQGRECFSGEPIRYLESIEANVEKKSLEQLKIIMKIGNSRLRAYEISNAGYLLFNPIESAKKIEVMFIPFYEKRLKFANDAPFTFNNCDTIRRDKKVN